MTSAPPNPPKKLNPLKRLWSKITNSKAVTEAGNQIGEAMSRR